jgi:RimJ/RimL family protein N-acetyltransferase
MRLELDLCQVRSWRASDAEPVTRHANNRKVWINLRDVFPHPYSRADAEAFIRASLSETPERSFAIVVDGEAAGGIGLTFRTDVERVSAELGYWLGELYWGRGIATAAVRGVTRFAVESHGLTRVYALPFAWNPASCRVLQKAGYALEGRLRRSAIKDGKIVDQLLYAYVAPAG